MNTIKENVELAILVANFIGLIIFVYKQQRDPDVALNDEIIKIKEACKYKHQAIDDNILVIKENHLRHMEADISVLKENYIEIKTILKERFK